MRALFIGLGGVGQRHLRNLHAVAGEDVEVLAYRVRGERRVVDDQLNVVPGADLVERYSVSVFSDLDAALARRPKVAFICNPTALHVPVALAAARAGCDLFVEKPLSHDLTGVQQLIREVEQRGLIAFVAYQLRQHPGFRRLAQLISEGALGAVYGVRAEVGEYLPRFHPYEDYRRMYASRSDLGGGVTLTQIHEIDYLCALFGMPERVFSMGGKVSGLDIDVDDYAASLLSCKRGDGRPLIIELHQDYLGRPPRRGCSVIGERGRIEWRLDAACLTRFDEDGGIVESHRYDDLPRNQMFLDEMRHFLDCVAQRKPPLVSLRDGARSLQVALALRESQRSGQPIELAEVADRNVASVASSGALSHQPAGGAP